MLREIYVKNFVLIDELRISFDEHMSAFTGETGAGKSLLMDAISILKGGRIQSSLIREGEEKAIIEGFFEVCENHPVLQVLKKAGFDIDDSCFVATREFTKLGKSTARINQRMVSATFLKEIISSIVDLHSQHDTQYLLNAKYHLSLLDHFANANDLLNKVAQAYKKYHDAQLHLKEALEQEYSDDILDLLTQQLNTIDEASIMEGELESLEEELKCMQAYEKISSKINLVFSRIEGNQDPQTTIYEAYRELDSIQEDSFYQNSAKQLLDCYYQLEQIFSDIKDHYDKLSFDEERFHELQERIFLIQKVLKRYGPTLSDVADYRNNCEARIDQILHRSDFIKKQEIIVSQYHEEYLSLANELHQLRKAKAKILQKEVVKQLVDLQLEYADFQIHFDKFEGNKTGIDQVSFLVSMNPGEPLKSLSATASGGELSRFMLGLKTVFSKLQGIETIIFDEIDTGVSGSVAFAVGKKMQELAAEIQVFSVTHLASVAACAHQHYLVEKTQRSSDTVTNIRMLTTSQRIEQLAIISNTSISDSALQAAQELFDKAQK